MAPWTRLWSRLQLWRAKRTFCQHLDRLGAEVVAEGTETFLEALFRLMCLAFLFDPKLRRNVEGFHGRYVFKSHNGLINVGVRFTGDNLELTRVSDPHVTVSFRDEKTLLTFLATPEPDLLDAMLKQDITTEGNLNYLYKMAYLAKHLRLQVAGQA